MQCILTVWSPLNPNYRSRLPLLPGDHREPCCIYPGHAGWWYVGWWWVVVHLPVCEGIKRSPNSWGIQACVVSICQLVKDLQVKISVIKGLDLQMSFVFCTRKMGLVRNFNIWFGIVLLFWHTVWRILHFTEKKFGRKNPRNGRKYPQNGRKNPKSQFERFGMFSDGVFKFSFGDFFSFLKPYVCIQ